METNTFSIRNALDTKVLMYEKYGKLKLYIFLDDKYLYKGPYNNNSLNETLNKIKKLKEWNVPFLLYPIEICKITDPIEGICSLEIIMNGGFFLKYSRENIDLSQTNIVRKKIHEKLQYNMIEPNTIKTLSSIIEKEEWIENYIPFILITLTCLYILDIKNGSLTNILVNDEKKIFLIINYDEIICRDKNKNNELYYFHKSLLLNQPLLLDLEDI